MQIPEHCKRFKIDVGLSYHAPSTEYWLERDPDVFVLGFEPNIYNLRRIYSDFHLRSDPPEFRKLQHKYIDKEAKILPFALGDKNAFLEFYCTKEDPGCSSLYKPHTLEVIDTIQVPCYTLDTILKDFDWNKFPYVDALKIDAQGHDAEILYGASETLMRTCYVFIEITSENLYKDCPDKYEDMKKFLESKGFTLVHIAPRGYNALFKNIRVSKEYIDKVEPLFIDS